MARARSGLGQGLEALVSPREWKETPPGVLTTEHHHPRETPQPLAPAAWEYAELVRVRGKRRRLSLSLAHPKVPGATAKYPVRGLGLLAALNALGAQGWELTGISNRRFYLRRSAPTATELPGH